MSNAKDVLEIRTRHWVGAAVTIAVLALAPGKRAADHGGARIAQRHDDDPGRPDPGAADEVRRQDRAYDGGFEAVLAGARGAAQGRAQRAPDHDRRLRLTACPAPLVASFRPRRSTESPPADCATPISIRRPCARRRARRSSPAAITTAAGFGVICRAGDGLSGLRQLHHQGQGDDRQDPQGQWLPDVVVRQEPQHACVPGIRNGPVRSVADRDGLRVLLRLHGRRRQASGSRTISPATRRTSTRSWAIPRST